MEPEPVFYWHIHHDALMEPRCGAIGDRLGYIVREKPRHELETRIRLLRRVRGPLPEPLALAGRDYAAAKQASDEAWRAFVAADAYSVVACGKFSASSRFDL